MVSRKDLTTSGRKIQDISKHGDSRGRISLWDEENRDRDRRERYIHLLMLIVTSLYSSTRFFNQMTAHVMQFVFPKLHPDGLYAYVTIHVSINEFN